MASDLYKLIYYKAGVLVVPGAICLLNESSPAALTTTTTTLWMLKGVFSCTDDVMFDLVHTAHTDLTLPSLCILSVHCLSHDLCSTRFVSVHNEQLYTTQEE